MAIKEVFLNPTVKKVVFQIRYPNLFAIEKIIGDYQLKIMDRFPNSQLLLKQQFVLADINVGRSIESRNYEPDSPSVLKIWNFTTDDGVELNIHTDSLDISSSLHKTYDNPDVDNRFRDSIQFAVDKFLETVNIIPKFTRIGLRYIDECPVSKKDNESFLAWYKSTFPLTRFPLERALNLKMEARVIKDRGFLKFSESFQDSNGILKYTLDFDGYKENIKSSEYLSTTDQLHELIAEEFKNSANSPLFDYMRRSPSKGE